MKPVRHFLTLAATLIALPAFADDKPLPLNQSADPETMLMQIDLKVALRQYERLQSDLYEAELQLALVENGALDTAAAEARQALAKTEYSEAPREEVERARKRYSDSKLVEVDRLKARLIVLKETAKVTRDKANAIAKALATRTTCGAP